MWIILATICFYNTAYMHDDPRTPICFKDALVPLRYAGETSCILVLKQLARDLQDDMKNRLIQMDMKCVKNDSVYFLDENYKHKEIDKLPLFEPTKKE